MERAGLRQLLFHDLRHTFGTRMIGKANIRRVQEWMAHSSIQTARGWWRAGTRAEWPMLRGATAVIPVIDQTETEGSGICAHGARALGWR